MNIFNILHDKIKQALLAVDLPLSEGQSLDFSRIVIEIPRDSGHGDLSTNAAMVFSRFFAKKPRELAELLVNFLKEDPDFAAVEIAGAGFINFRFEAQLWQTLLQDILQKGVNYGRSQIGQKIKINVEYISANPTGPLHVGHCRGAVVGDVLANLLSFVGYDVTKEYYMNDAGAQINVLAQSVFLRYRQALGFEIGQIAEGLYPGDYLIPVGEALAQKYGDTLCSLSSNDALEKIKPFALDAMMKLIKDDLALLNIHHDVFFSEQSLHAHHGRLIRDAIDELSAKGYVYKGKLPPPKGQIVEDWEDREQLLLSSTKVGDDIDRPLVKSDGSYTYFAADLAYFKDKYQRGFQKMIYVLGADHGGYVKRLQAVAKAIADDSSYLKVLVCQLVRLMRDGEVVRMSKRAGKFIMLRDVVEEVGRDPIRFMMIYRKNDVPFDFDFARVTEQSKDNPVFYVQYAHARCHSILRQAQEMLGLTSQDCDVSVLQQHIQRLVASEEIDLIKKMIEYARIIQQAAIGQEPHKLAFYLYELASVFHAHWNKGNEDPSLRFIMPNDKDLTLARLGLVQSFIFILASGLRIIGVNAPHEM